jgi:hypothetical protein
MPKTLFSHKVFCPTVYFKILALYNIKYINKKNNYNKKYKKYVNINNTNTFNYFSF